jgi:hypothetical protein
LAAEAWELVEGDGSFGVDVHGGLDEGSAGKVNREGNERSGGEDRTDGADAEGSDKVETREPMAVWRKPRRAEARPAWRENGARPMAAALGKVRPTQERETKKSARMLGSSRMWVSEPA